MNPQEEFRNKNDDYAQTIHAIIGFTNFYRHDDASRSMKDNVVVFQGRRMEPSPDKVINSNGEKVLYVTPDIGVLLPSKKGVLCEVKKSFPKEQEHWIKTFEQLMSYDDNLTGWPSDDGKVNSHDIVLILHQSREVAVRMFYEKKSGSEIKFNKPFVIVQFNRADERGSYYFFQKTLGSLSEKSVDERLTYGVPVPMGVFTNVVMYSIIKLYDSEPPLPYLIDLIWTHVVTQSAKNDPKFEKLRKNQKIDVVLGIEKIVEELHQGFSFRTLYSDNSGRQLKIPKKKWVVNACEQLVKSNEASWVDSTKTTIKVFFRRYDATMDHFIELCSKEEESSGQMEMKFIENKESD